MRSQRSRIFLSFQPTRPLRGATLLTLIRFASLLYFNPRAPCGARQNVSPNQSIMLVFQPTRPLRGATTSLIEPDRLAVISTHAPLAGRDFGARFIVARTRYFNPRAPCGARQTSFRLCRQLMDFNPRAPCGARRAHTARSMRRVTAFQPTRPLRGATVPDSVSQPRSTDFNPRAPCGARPSIMATISMVGKISTHAPLAGRDEKQACLTREEIVFQPTRPLRGATFSSRRSIAR